MSSRRLDWQQTFPHWEGPSGIFLGIFCDYVQYFSRVLLGYNVPPASEVTWCPDLQTAMDEIAALNFELYEWKVLFLGVEQTEDRRGMHHVLSLTTVNGHSWTTRLLPWNVAVSLKDELKEIFYSQQFLKVIRTADCETRIVMDIAGIICVIRARALMALNVYDYSKADPSYSDRDDDVTALNKVTRLYVSEICANEMRESPVFVDEGIMQPRSAWYFGRRAAFLPLLFFHGVATCHGLLLGPSQLSDDPEQILPATADYLNASGGVSNPWLPSLGDSGMSEELQIDWLSPERGPAVPWEGSAQAMGIKTQERGQVGELEIVIHLEEDDMGFPMEQEVADAALEKEATLRAEEDRKVVQEIMKQAKHRPSPSRKSLPTLETIDEVQVDPFGPALSRSELEEVGRLDQQETAKYQNHNVRVSRSKNADKPPSPDVLWPDQVDGDSKGGLPRHQVGQGPKRTGDPLVQCGVRRGGRRNDQQDVQRGAEHESHDIQRGTRHGERRAEGRDFQQDARCSDGRDKRRRSQQNERDINRQGGRPGGHQIERRDAERCGDRSREVDHRRAGDGLRPIPTMERQRVSPASEGRGESGDRLLQAAVAEGRVLDEEVVAGIPRFPSPWIYIPAPKAIAPASRILKETLSYHPLVDRPFAGSFTQHSVHRRLWEHLPEPQDEMLATPEGSSLRRVHHNHFKVRRSMGATGFWLGSLCTTCGRPRHPSGACTTSDRSRDPAFAVPCCYCRQRHPVSVCVMLHTRCQKCGRLGHFPALCRQHTGREWYVYFLRYVHLGLFTGVNELGPQFGRFGFGPTGKDISDNPTCRLLEEMATKKIQGTITMLSLDRLEYVRKVTFVLDPVFLVPEVHVARARLILMLRGIYIRDPGDFKRDVFERLSRLESYQRMTQPWLPLPPGQRPWPEDFHDQDQ